MQNNQLTFLRQNWNNAWVNLALETYGYNANNNITSALYQNWNSATWVNISLTTYTYDVNNNNTSRLRQYWNGSAWNNTILYSYTYNINNNRINALQQFWTINNTWENDFQNTYTYDANNNLISDISQQWTLGSWLNKYLLSYTYDLNNFQISFVIKSYNSTGTTITSGDSIHIYSHTVTAINNLQPSDAGITLYPNPATTTVTITLNNTIIQQHPNTLTLYDLTGRALLQQPFTSSPHHLNIASLKSGMYIIEIMDKEGRGVKGKMVKN